MTASTLLPSVAIEAFPDRETFQEAAALFIAGNIYQGLLARGRADLVVTGGSTVRHIYDRLSRAALAWKQVYITLSDERWVAAQSGESNERLVRSHLLQNHATAANFVGLKTSHEKLEDAVASVTLALKQLKSPKDLVVLGMGEDGHVASLFPNHPVLSRALDAGRGEYCVAVREAYPAPVQSRISLSLRSIMDARAILIVATGADKRRTFERALRSLDSQTAPVSALLRQADVPIRFFWSP